MSFPVRHVVSFDIFCVSRKLFQISVLSANFFLESVFVSVFSCFQEIAELFSSLCVLLEFLFASFEAQKSSSS